jgi:hypothetical protein
MDRFNFMALVGLGLRTGKEKPPHTCHAIANFESGPEANACFSVKTIEKAMAAFHLKLWRGIPFSDATQLQAKRSPQKPSIGVAQ